VSKQTRLPFELDERVEEGLLTAHAGAPLVIEYFQTSGAAAVLEREASTKQRRRGLGAAAMAESLFALWATGGERCEDLEELRADRALAELLGHGLPAAQTARDWLESFHQDDLPLWQAGEKSSVPSESAPLAGLAAANRELCVDVQARLPQATATLDVDAKVYLCDKRAARPTYEGGRGYQPVFALWAEQDLIVADEFRDGNVPAGSGNRRVVERAVAALPPGVEQILLRGDSALYEHELLRWLDEKKIGFAVSADVSPPLLAALRALPEAAWQTDAEEADAVRQWAEVAFVPDDGDHRKDAPAPFRYLAIRLVKTQGLLFADGSDRRHFCVVTNREGDGLELLRWHRGKAGTIEHAHHVLANELAAGALPSQKFGANAAWMRLNVILYNLLSGFKRIALPPEEHAARPKRLRFLLLNVVGKVIRHARATLLRLTDAVVRGRCDRARVQVHRPRLWAAPA
jgi:hypothetical protein